MFDDKQETREAVLQGNCSAKSLKCILIQTNVKAPSQFEAEIQSFAFGCYQGGCYGTKCCILDFFVLQCKNSFAINIIVV